MDDSRELGLAPSPDPTPAVLYANHILVDLITRKTKSITLVESQGLPSIPTTDDGDCSEPADFTHVVNRLKIMVELDPVSYKEPVHGLMAILKDDMEYIIRMDFDDRPPDSSCVITLSAEDKADYTSEELDQLQSARGLLQAPKSAVYRCARTIGRKVFSFPCLYIIILAILWVFLILKNGFPGIG